MMASKNGNGKSATKANKNVKPAAVVQDSKTTRKAAGLTAFKEGYALIRKDIIACRISSTTKQQTRATSKKSLPVKPISRIQKLAAKEVTKAKKRASAKAENASTSDKKQRKGM